MEWLKYNTASQQLFTVLLTANSRNAQADPTLATGDVTVSKDGGAFANISTLPDVLPASGVQVRIQLSAAELQCKILTIRFRDQTTLYEWDEQYVQVCTYGHANAFLSFDFSQTTPAVNLTQIDGNTTAGNNAILNLKSLNIDNDSGNAVTINSANNGGISITSKQNGISINSTEQAGISITAFANGVYISGGSTGMYLLGSTLEGLYVRSSTSDAMRCESVTADKHALSLKAGGGTGNDLNLETPSATPLPSDLVSIDGNPTDDNSATLALKKLSVINTTEDHAVEIIANAVTHSAVHIRNDDKKAVNIESGDGQGLTIQAETYAIYCTSLGQLTPAVFITANPTGNADAVRCVGGSNGSGMYLKGGSTGPGLTCEGGNVTAGIFAFCTSFGHGVWFKAAGPAFHGIMTEGSGTGAGLRVESPEGSAIDVSATLGNGINVAAPEGDGVNIAARNTGITTIATNGAGLFIQGAAYGLECYGEGGDGNGNGALFGPVVGKDGSGIIIRAFGNEAGLRITSEDGPALSAVSDTGAGAHIEGDTAGLNTKGTAGPGIKTHGTHGISSNGGSGHGLSLTGSGDGMSTVGAAGRGIYANGSIDGIRGSGVGGHGIAADGYHGIAATGVTGNGIESIGANDGIRAIGTAGDGVEAIGGENGMQATGTAGSGVIAAGETHGIRATGETGSGMTLRKGTGGNDLKFETPDCTIPVTTDVSNQVQADMTAIDGSSSAAQRLSISAQTMATGTVDDTVFAPTVTEFESADVVLPDTAFFTTRTLIVTSGLLVRQARTITGYALVGGKAHFTVKPLTQPLSDGDTFIIV